VVLDLEDAVPAQAKDAARATVAELLERGAARPLWVRLNPPGSGLLADDLRAAARPGLAGVRLAKAEDPEAVAAVGAALAGGGAGHAAIHCLLESALGLERAYALATAHPAVQGLALGEADLRADLGAASDEGLLYARSRCVAAARAAGLPPPVQSVWTHVRDLEGLRASCRRGRALGFVGRAAVHPAQLPVIHEAYSPTPGEVAEARALVARLEEAERAGRAAFALPDGRLVDRGVAETALRTLALAERLEAAAR
jgi:citrate lyase subunit beta/citryl-CoA lyase